MNSPIWRWIFWRTLGLIILLWLASMMIFFTLTLAPGDAASQALGDRATPQALGELRHQYGLDRPLLTRYSHWLGGMLQGDPGTSPINGVPVAELIAPAAWHSAALALPAAAGMLLLGIFGGAVAALYRNRWPDRFLSLMALGGLSMPEFIIATLAILVFAVGTGWLPAVSVLPPSGRIGERWSILILPAMTLALIGGCYLQRMVRATLVGLVTAPDIRSARLNGVGGTALVLHHLLPQALGPLTQLCAVTLPWLFGGAIVVERVFAWPGLGELLITALNTRDALLLQGVAMLLATLTGLCWLVADMFAHACDPYRRRG